MEPSPEQNATQNALRALTRETLHFCLRYDEPDACRRMVEQAVETRQTSAVDALCELLAPSRGLRRRWQLRRRVWTQTRAQAALALGILGDPKALPALVAALSDTRPEIRSAARQSILAFDQQAVTPMLLSLKNSNRWTPEGMTLLIQTLGALGDKRAGPILARVLFQQIPPSSSRWTNATLVGPLITLTAIVLSLWFGTVVSNEMTAEFALLSLMLALVLGGAFFLMFQVCLLLPISAVWERGERHRLSMVTADALAELRDKKALPSVIEAIHNANTAEKAKLHRTLALLLSLLGPEDAGLLSGHSLLRLTELLSQTESYQTFAILGALEHVGTGVCVPAIERLTKRGRTPEIRAHAERLLPVLEERRKREQAPTFLLRASSAPRDPKEELLRPVTDIDPATPPEQLLRAGEATK